MDLSNQLNGDCNKNKFEKTYFYYTGFIDKYRKYGIINAKFVIQIRGDLNE